MPLRIQPSQYKYLAIAFLKGSPVIGKITDLVSPASIKKVLPGLVCDFLLAGVEYRHE